MAFERNTRVRLKFDPSRIGTCTGRTKLWGGILHHLVDFPGEAPSYEPEDNLEEIGNLVEHPLDLLEQGRFGRVADLRRVLTHVRLAGKLSDLIYSMEVSNTDFYAYQFKPVLKMLNSPANGILVADEVGLGKTIEAGLVWTEMRSRYDLRRLMVLCPAMLREKWQLELRNRFGVKAEIVDARGAHDALKGLARDEATDSFAIIASLQGLRPPRGWDDTEKRREGSAALLARFLEERRGDDHLIDLLVIDEAHYLRNPESQTAKLGRLLRDVADHVVLLSATPVHLHNGDLFQLLNLIDEDTFNHPYAFDEILNANAPLVKLRDHVLSRNADAATVAELVESAMHHPLLRESRQLKDLQRALPSQEALNTPDVKSEIAHRVETVNLMSNVVTRTRKRDVHERRVVREATALYVPPNDLEREFYDVVTGIVRNFCQSKDFPEGFLLATPQRQMSSCMAAALRVWQTGGSRVAEELYEDVGIEEAPDVEGERPLIGHLVAVAGRLGSYEDLRKNDSKFEVLRTGLLRLLKEDPREKVVLFSYFKATLAYLNERLGEAGLRPIVLSGDSGKEKGKILEAFAADSGPNILLSSEVGSEGIDLQFSRVVINYDLPWNPMRVEQRIGRVDRIGQKSEKISIWNLFYDETIDSRIYTRLYERLEIFKTALGDLEEVLGEKIRELTGQLLSQDLTPEQEERRIDQTATALANVKRQEEQLESESASLVAYGDYILNQVKAARDMHRWISGRDIFGLVHDVLRERYPAGCSFHQLDSQRLLFEVGLSPDARHDLERFIGENRLSSRTKLSGLTGAPVRCLFENKIAARGEAGVEVIDQVHPLTRFVSHLADDLQVDRHPAVSIRLGRRLAGTTLPSGDYVFLIQKWSFAGLQQTERLYYAVIPSGAGGAVLQQQDAERLTVAAAMHGRDWREASEDLALPAVSDTGGACLAAANAEYARQVKAIDNQNQDRVDIHVKNLENHRESQLAKFMKILEGHRVEGRPGLVSATEGRIRALEERVRRKIVEAESRRKIACHKDEICAGVIRLE